MNSGAGEITTIDFIKTVFGDTSEAPVFICSLVNEGEPEDKERRVSTRDASDILRFVSKWDRSGRSIYFCVGTIVGGHRNKANVAETIGLHADIDLKDILENRAGVEKILANLELPPSVTVFSGNGIHAYWLFKEASIKEQDRIEDALKLLCDLLGGDRAVTHPAALMRLPGSHNTKRDAWTPVEVLTLTNVKYELDDLEDWLSRTSPKILRKERPSSQPSAEDNPFLRAAALLGFKPSIDVEKRLQRMMYMGGGEESVHATQVSVSASLLNGGRNVDEVTDILLQATKAAAGEYGVNWNWRREERNIRNMCATWVKKHPPQQQQPASPPKAIAENGPAKPGNVVSLADAAAAVRKPKAAKSNVAIHILLGEAVIAAIRHRGDDLVFTPKAAWRYTAGLWSLEIDGLRSWLDMEIETACRELNIDSTNKVVGEARQWIMRNPTLWREDIRWDAHGQVPCRSGLIDPLTLTVTPPAADQYVTWRIECDYEPPANCPWWLVMIDDFFGDRLPGSRQKHINVVQECLGAAMVDIKPRALSKALILQGGSNFGKSGILEVLSGLFGSEQIATGLEALEGSHGLMAFTRRLPWVLHEAFDQRRWHFSSAVKAIITGEPVSINIKNGPMLSQRVKSPIFWGTNHPPQFKEATKAIVNRLIVIECRREFTEGQPVGTAAEAFKRGFDKPSTLVLETELPGLLNWALAGLQRALARQFIELTDEMRDTADEIRRDSNLVAGFLDECIGFDPDRRVSVPDFCASFSVWWLENKGEDRRMPSNEAVSKALVAMSDPRIAIHSKELRDNSRRYYAGIILNEQGIGFHRRAGEAKMFEGKVASTTASDGQVNSSIPEGWSTRPSVIAMRRRQEQDSFVNGLKNVQFGTVTGTVTGSQTVTENVSPVTELSPKLTPEEMSAKSKTPRF